MISEHKEEFGYAAELAMLERTISENVYNRGIAERSVFFSSLFWHLRINSGTGGGSLWIDLCASAAVFF